MAKFIKNNSGIVKTYIGQQLADQEYYEIQSHEELSWSNHSPLLIDIASGDAIIATDNSGSGDISDVAIAINHLKDENPIQTIVDSQPPFAAKVLPNGKKLYSRVEGKSYSVSVGSNILDFTIAYPEVKFNELEIIGSELGDTATLRIKDDASGTYSTVPNYTLNTFGNNVNCTKDYYHRASNYDADLYYGMRIYIEFESQSAKTIYINYVLHELKV